MNYLSTFLSIVPVFVLAMALTVYYINRKSLANRLFSLFLLVVFGWLISGYLYYLDQGLVYRLLPVQMGFGSFLGGAFLLFTLAFVDDRYRIRKRDILYLVPSFAILSVCVSIEILPDLFEWFQSTVSMTGNRLIRKPNALYTAYTAVLIFGCAAGLVVLVRASLSERDAAARRRIRVILLSLFLGIMGTLVLSNVLTLAGRGGYERYTLIPVFIGIVGVGFTVLRHRAWTVEHLLDIIDGNRRELAESNDKLRSLDRLKSDFFSNVSHELRTPLTLIIGPLEAVLGGGMGEIPAGVRGHLEAVRRNSLRLLNLINELLDFAKIDSGRTELVRQKTELNRLVRFYLDTVYSSLEVRKVRVDYRGPRAPVWAELDRGKFEKIFFNIISNAIKFTPTGGSISVALERSGPDFTLAIADTGPGIPADTLPRIFERFSSFAADRSGTGIGLALCREFAELHGGDITARSEAGAGSEFIIRMPALDAGSEAGEAPVGEIFDTVLLRQIRAGAGGTVSAPDSAAVRGAAEPERGDKALVLVVDDSGEMREFIAHILRGSFEVVTAGNGREGLDLAVRLSPQLVVSDVMMPVMDGYELVQRMKGDPRLSVIPIILLTAKADLDFKIEGLRYGADDYLVKPFNQRELLARVESLVRAREYQRIIAERNREIEGELEIARLLQTRLLPGSGITVPGFLMHFAYRPMDKVGGDFFDHADRGGGAELFIADVSGHGLPGAFLATVTKIGLDGIRERGSADGVLRQLNEVICRATVNANFVTAFFCILDRERMRIRYSSAGHLPQVLYRRRDNACIELRTPGTPLGWFRDIRLTEGEHDLETGDRLVLHTDGIVECANAAGEMFGEKRFYDFIAEHRDLDPHAFLDRLMGEIGVFAGTDNFADDITCLVIDVVGG